VNTAEEEEKGRRHKQRRLKGRTGGTPIGYSGQTALRREQCGLLHVHPLPGNGLLNTLPQKETRGTIGRLLLGNEAVNTLLRRQ
jgi:hypothetical protein